MRRKFVKGSAILGTSLAANTTIKGLSGMINGNSSRKVYRILDANKVNVGTLPVLRAFAGDKLDYVSPFVLFDEFGPVSVKAGDDPLRVDAHPHAGVTPTTYFLAGTGHHRDSLDYDFQIAKGDFMMFKSGSGAIHMEESGQKLYDEGGDYHGFQIWLNTPAAYKFEKPATTIDNESKMALIKKDNVSIKVVLGELWEHKSEIETHASAFYYHIKMDKDSRISIPTEPTHNAFLYSINGTIELEGNKSATNKQVVLYHRGNSTIDIYTKDGAELLLLGGQPLNEPVFSYGPFVMNNEEQIRQCITNYNNGLMGDPNLVNN